jgi:hypothetical protein
VAKQGNTGEKWPLNFAYEASFHACRVPLHAVNQRHVNNLIGEEKVSFIITKIKQKMVVVYSGIGLCLLRNTTRH